jgi:hypothetical protein
VEAGLRQRLQAKVVSLTTNTRAGSPRTVSAADAEGSSPRKAEIRTHAST